MQIKCSDIYTAKKFNDQLLVINNVYSKTVVGSYLLGYQNRFFKSNLINDYLLNYKVNSSKAEFGSSLGTFMSSKAAKSLLTTPLEENLDDAIFLKKVKKGPKGNLVAALDNRKSYRNFINKGIKLSDLSSLLQFSLSAKDNVESDRFYPRPYPAGGGLYSIYLYMLVKNVKGLKNGIYKYQPYSHSLLLINDNINKNLNSYCNMSGIDIDHVDIVGFWAYDLRKNSLKYGDMAMALALVECGHAMQNINLLSYFYGLGICELGGFNKKFIEKSLKLDGVNNHVVGCFVMGVTV